MLCVTFLNYLRTCAPLSGGISDILAFDPDDFTFTQAAAVDGVEQPYTAVALRTDAVAADGALMFAIQFTRDEAEWTWKQSVKGCNVKYEHTLTFQLPENSQTLTTFMQALDAASCCCGIGLIIRLITGKILVAGEKYVNDASIPRFTMINNGSSGGSGKLQDDFNGGTLVLTGSFSRSLFEFTGDWADLEALETA